MSNLLTVRYKVIADYPNSFFIRDEILEKRIGKNYLWSNIKDISRAIYLENIDDYPHLFKKLEWWEHRLLNELPNYVKVVNGRLGTKLNGNVFWVKAKGVFDLKEKPSLDKDASVNWCMLYGYENRFNYAHFDPATENDYLNQEKSNYEKTD